MTSDLCGFALKLSYVNQLFRWCTVVAIAIIGSQLFANTRAALAPNSSSCESTASSGNLRLLDKPMELAQISECSAPLAQEVGPDIACESKTHQLNFLWTAHVTGKPEPLMACNAKNVAKTTLPADERNDIAGQRRAGGVTQPASAWSRLQGDTSRTTEKAGDVTRAR